MNRSVIALFQIVRTLKRRGGQVLGAAACFLVPVEHLAQGLAHRGNLLHQQRPRHFAGLGRAHDRELVHVALHVLQDRQLVDENLVQELAHAQQVVLAETAEMVAGPAVLVTLRSAVSPRALAVASRRFTHQEIVQDQPHLALHSGEHE
jgi:hypothetical protein